MKKKLLALILATAIAVTGCKTTATDESTPSSGTTASTEATTTETVTEVTTTEATTTAATTTAEPLPPMTTTPADEDSLRGAYDPIFNYLGNAVNGGMFNDPERKAAIVKHYSSVTAENEFKPESLLSSKPLITVEEAKAQGYFIPEGYAEDKVPTIKFDTVKNFLKSARENGLKVRFHTLVWHNQSPSWFFKEGYDNANDFATVEVMDKREELYVKSLIKYVCESPYGDVVYAWDVVNEYLNSNGQGCWNKIYKSDKSYVYNAFKYASEELTALGMRDKYKLFYNDFNTYEKTNSIINLINEINKDGHYCDGVGMQMHLDVGYPTVEKIGDTIDKFKEAGFEIQITELDATLNGEWYKGPELTPDDQTKYYGDLFKMMIEKKNGGANITSLTFWGLYDGISWRRKYVPLIFTTLDEPKDAYYEIMEAAKQ